MSESMEIPKYRSIKLVRALKIAGVRAFWSQSGGLIVPEDENFAPFTVSAEYMEKHKPKAGGYYVVYKDGYKSWSPAEAFESGHVKV